MPAWTHNRIWTNSLYEVDYRDFVKTNAKNYEGDTRDCADLSMLLLIKFAVKYQLPVTFYDKSGVRYLSLSDRQWPTSVPNKTWKNEKEYTDVALGRTNALMLLTLNTEAIAEGPKAGDLMIKEDHAALVFDVFAAHVPHPNASLFERGIPAFPGPDKAKGELNQTKYFRSNPRGPVSSPSQHIDYLNHRGEGIKGQPKKEKAELIFFADVADMIKDGFKFRRFNMRVRDNWPDYKGEGEPPLHY